MYYSNELIGNYYNYILLNTKEAEPALNYLLERGITKDTIKIFNIGYAPDQNIAVQFFKTQEIDLDLVQRSGLVNKSSDNSNYYDVFKNRIMFPIKDNIGRVVAFSGRTMSTDKTTAKYYNTHETEIFEKRNVLYNFSEARQYIVKEKQIVICEGYMDVIKAYQYGVKNIVALMGTNIDEYKLKEILTLTNNVVLALDSDSAGINATINIGDDFLKLGTNVYKLNFTIGKDIDEYITERVKKDINFNFKDYVTGNREHYIDFKIKYLSNITKNDIENKITSKNKLLINISSLSDQSLKDILLTSLSENFGIEKQTLLRELFELEKNRRQIIKPNNIMFNDVTKVFSNVKYDKKLCTLFKYFFVDRTIFLEFYQDLESIYFKENIFNTLLDNLIIYYNNYRMFELHKFLTDVFDKELINLVTYIDSSDSIIISIDINKDIIRDYIKYLKNINSSVSEVENLKEDLKTAILEASYEKQLAILESLKKYKK